MNRARVPEAEVEGRPHLAVADADLEAVSELIAEALIATLEREEERPS